MPYLCGVVAFRKRLHIENYCEDELEFRNGLPVSTKGDDNYHGFGMKSIQYVVEKYECSNLDARPFANELFYELRSRGHEEAEITEAHLENFLDYSSAIFNPQRFTPTEVDNYMIKYVLHP